MPRLRAGLQVPQRAHRARSNLFLCDRAACGCTFPAAPLDLIPKQMFLVQEVHPYCFLILNSRFLSAIHFVLHPCLGQLSASSFWSTWIRSAVILRRTKCELDSKIVCWLTIEGMVMILSFLLAIHNTFYHFRNDHRLSAILPGYKKNRHLIHAILINITFNTNGKLPYSFPVAPQMSQEVRLIGPASGKRTTILFASAACK